MTGYGKWTQNVIVGKIRERARVNFTFRSTKYGQGTKWFDYGKYGRSTEGKRSHILMLVLDGVRTFSKSKCRYGIRTRTCTPEYALYSYLLMGVGEVNFLKQDEIFFYTRYEICIWKQHLKDFKNWILETSQLFNLCLTYLILQFNINGPILD